MTPASEATTRSEMRSRSSVGTSFRVRASLRDYTPGVTSRQRAEVLGWLIVAGMCVGLGSVVFSVTLRILNRHEARTVNRSTRQP